MRTRRRKHTGHALIIDDSNIRKGVNDGPFAIRDKLLAVLGKPRGVDPGRVIEDVDAQRQRGDGIPPRAC